MIPFLMGLGALLLTLLALLVVARRRGPRFFRRPVHPVDATHGFARKKPQWVRREVIRLKALMPHEGCRTVARAFNSLHGNKGETVGKSYVAHVIKCHALEVRVVRKAIKNRKRRQGPRNHTWAMDLTFLSRDKDSRPALGILDHGTRALLALRELRDRTAVGVLRALLDAVEKFGRPRFLRTDNEGVLTSRVMAFALLALGIRHQRIDPFCPWQNGRIERLFKTLKERLHAYWAEAGFPDDLQQDLVTFRVWYNHARPHQSLQGLTPATAWAGMTETSRLRFFSAWEGRLTGYVAWP